MAGVVRPTTVIRKTGTAPVATGTACWVGFGAVWANATPVASTPVAKHAETNLLIMKTSGSEVETPGQGAPSGALRLTRRESNSRRFRSGRLFKYGQAVKSSAKRAAAPS